MHRQAFKAQIYYDHVIHRCILSKKIFSTLEEIWKLNVLQNEFLQSICADLKKVLKSFDVPKNKENLYNFNIISENLQKDLFDNISKPFRHFHI